MVTDQRLRADDPSGNRTEFEILGEWTTGNGNRLSLKARRRTGYASVWLDYRGKPARIGYALHAGGVVREVRWDVPWNEQTDAWKTQQRNHIAALIADWHAGNPQPTESSPLPASIAGTFDFFGFRFAVEPTVASDHAVLSVVNVAGGLTPVADLLHDNGRICGMSTRAGWKGTPEDRKRHWRMESEAILSRAATEGRL